jgi:crotonobetainyl-CoA:carnitine CoA-transferase CaiB-like acyl-CoA transferase
MTSDRSDTLPMAGVKVLDFSRFMPGSYCTLLLADFGADVICIEQPREVAKHDRMFGYEKLSKEQRSRVRAHDILHRNKRSILLDFRRPEGLEAVRQLTAQSDVMVHDYRPGVFESAGLDYASVREVNSRLIYLAVSLCGQTGPYRNLPGHDPMSLALAGVLPQIGETREQPRMADAPLSDTIAALHGAIGILVALRAREQTGNGQQIDLAMSDTALSIMLLMFSRYLPDKQLPKQPRYGGNNGVWRTKDDKWICTTDIEPGYWTKWCDLVGREDLKARYRDRLENHDELVKIFESKTRDEWFALFREAETQGAPVLSCDEVLRDPHQRARGNIVDLVDADIGEIRQIGPLLKLSDTPAGIRSLAHEAGADTRSVLTEFGIDTGDIDKLIDQAQSEFEKETR